MVRSERGLGDRNEGENGRLKSGPARVRLKRSSVVVSGWQSVILIAVIVQSALANRPPRFLIDGQSEIVVRLKEGPDTPIGSLIYRLRGVDPDGDALRFGLRDHVGGDVLRLEAITANEANIYLVKELDREVRDEYSFVLTLTDGHLGEGNFISQSFLLLVEDVNDNEPIFKPYPTAISVRENTPPAILTTVEATDLDEGAYGQVLYHLQELDGDVENFSVQTVNGKGVVKLLRSLDYERKSLYQLRILAVDRANQGRVNTGTAAILVKVQDEEDQPPEFVVATPVTRISEDATIGTAVLQVRAVDGDRGISNRISYSIISGGEEFFDIDSSSGIVYTVNQLDREDPTNSNGAYILEILATEESKKVSPLPSATTEVTVIVTDVNDETPQFRSKRYTCEVLENAQQNTPLTFLQDAIPEVFDYDQGTNGTFELFLQGDGGVFEVTPSRGINEASFLIRVRDPARLDYEKVAAMNFSLVAREMVADHPKMSVVPIAVRIRDENDNFPEFSQPLYSASLPENSAEGTTVARVKASDPDSGDFGSRGVRYTSLSGGIAHLLSLHPTTGIISIKTAGGDAFDRELVARHYLSVEARDDLGRGNRNSAQLVLDIEDVNDNAPVFLAKRYEARLLENDLQFEAPLVLEARDLDLNGTRNSHVEYSIVGGELRTNFSVDPQLGILSPRGPLDFEQLPGDNSNIRLVHLTVRARDFGSPPLWSSVPVSVVVQDVNDHAPAFQQLQYKRAIPEDVAGGTSVLEVRARDLDGSAPNNLVLYRLQRASDKFSLDARSGVLSVAEGSSLDPDATSPKTSSYLLTVVAFDGGVGEQQLSAAVSVNVSVVDVNNKAPVFREPGSLAIKENLPVGSVVFVAQAEDADEQPVLRYSLDAEASVARDQDGARLPAAAADLGALWALDPLDGTLRVAGVLDRERMETLRLLLRVEDLAAAGARQTATAALALRLLDENDNDPAFRQSAYRAAVPENAPPGTPVLQLRADDRDADGSISYQLRGPAELLQLLRVDNASGEVVVAGRIDRERHAWLNLTAEAEDGGRPPRLARTNVSVQVLDENDNNPVFEGGPLELRVREDAAPGTVVAHVLAGDLDAGDFGKVTYLLDRTSTQGKFLINAETGALTVSEWLDRETQPSYSLVVEAWDNYQFGFLSGEARNAFKQIQVLVDDVNDNAPELLLPAECVSITEFHDPRTPIVAVSATDRDDSRGPNGRVQFHLVGGKGHELFRFEQAGGAANSARLFARQPLQDRFGNYSLQVAARDLGSPGLEARGLLALCVADYNDHAPLFVAPPHNVTLKVPENATVGSLVVQLRAVDADVGPNGLVRYRLLQDAAGAWRSFSVHASSGALRTARALDREQQTTFQLRLEAFDLGSPTPLSSTLELTVYVQNVDSYRPRFPRRLFAVNMTENSEREAAYLPSVLERDAIDRGDEPALPVCYFLVRGNEGGAFQLDRSTHRLSVVRALDREERAEYVLTVLAAEECAATPTFSPDADAGSTLEVRVVVMDLNDNAPKFVSEVFTGGVTTDADFGTEFMTVKATDADAGANAEVTYALEGEVQKTLAENMERLERPFSLDARTGAVALNFDPQKGMRGYFDFKVVARDAGGLAASARVFIYLLRRDQRVRFVLRWPPAHVRDRVGRFRRALAAVTGCAVNVDELRVHEARDGAADRTRSDLYLHLVSEAHQVLDVAQVLRLLDQHVEQLDELFKEFNVLDTQPAQLEPPLAQSLSAGGAAFWLGWAALLLLLLLALTLLGCASQRAAFGRRLKAAKAPAYSSPAAGESDLTIRSSAARVPNTNKHCSKGSNPIWLHAYDNDWYKPDEVDPPDPSDPLSDGSERDSLDGNALERDLSNEKPYFITSAAFAATKPAAKAADDPAFDFYQQLEALRNAKNMETTEL